MAAITSDRQIDFWKSFKLIMTISWLDVEQPLEPLENMVFEMPSTKMGGAHRSNCWPDHIWHFFSWKPRSNSLLTIETRPRKVGVGKLKAIQGSIKVWQEKRKPELQFKFSSFCKRDVEAAAARREFDLCDIKMPGGFWDVYQVLVSSTKELRERVRRCVCVFERECEKLNPKQN